VAAKMRNIYVKGLDGLMDAYRQAGQDAPVFAHRALFEEAQEAFNLTQERVPVRLGDLRSSGDVSSELRGTRATALIRYGGGAVDYAVFVHEIPPSRAKHAPPTAWKFVENPVKLYSKGMAERMRVRVLDMIHRRF
jgi:hypothetical protein